MSKLAQAGASSTVSPAAATAAARATACSSVRARSTGTATAASAAEPVALLRRVGQAERDEALAREGAAGDRACAERHDARAHPRDGAPRLRVVAIHDREVLGLLRGEEARLRLAVLGEARVAV